MLVQIANLHYFHDTGKYFGNILTNIPYLSFMLYFANLSFFKGNHANKAYILQQNIVGELT